MGCVSQGGCLGPKRRQRDVYAELVESIHEQACKIQFSDNLNIYSAIRQKLSKKGFIRKLLDNLTSHRANINDCLSHNLRLTTQSVNLQNKYAGLIILNEIVNNLYQQKKITQLLDERTMAKTGSSMARIVPASQKEKERYVGATIDLRGETQFFRLVTHLLQNEGRMYQKTLESILRFCEGRKEPFGCRVQVWRVLQLILKKIQRNLMVEESAAGYLALIGQLRESNQDEIDYQSVFLAFIRLWLQRHKQEQVYEGAEASLQIKYQQILRVIVRRSISVSKPIIIYRALFTIYDEERFYGANAIATEQMLITIIREDDLHSPVIRGIFIYMLQYLSITNIREKSASWRSSGGDQFHVGRYPKIMEKGGRLRAFQTLRRWAEKGYFNLEEYISFGSSALVGAYTANLSLEKQYAKEVMRQFLRLTEPLKPSITLILVSLLMEEIRWQNGNDGLRQILIALVREVVGERGLLQQQQSKDNFTYFIPLDTTFARDTRLQLIQLMGFIAKRVPGQHFTVQDNINSHFSHNLCEFFHSIFQGMLSPGSDARPGKKPQDDQILFRYQFANSVISFMKCLCQRGGYPYVLSFIAAVVASISEAAAQGKLTLYFTLYSVYEGMHLLNSKQKLPDKMVALNFRLVPSLKAQEIKGEIEGVVDYLIGLRGQYEEKLVSSLQSSIAQLREFIMISENHFNQVNASFADYFKGKKKRESMYMETSKNQFRRDSFNGSCNESSRDRSRIQEDESFKDVMDRIMNI